jgi:hypothetical protein
MQIYESSPPAHENKPWPWRRIPAGIETVEWESGLGCLIGNALVRLEVAKCAAQETRSAAGGFGGLQIMLLNALGDISKMRWKLLIRR